jgi:hypothetical protein
MNYQRKVGRVGVEYRPDFGDARSVTITCVAGWNDYCPTLENILSIEEVRDLRYLLDRVIAASERTS